MIRKKSTDGRYKCKKKTVPYKLFFISLVRRQVKRWQGNCGNKLKPADNGDYLLIK